MESGRRPNLQDNELDGESGELTVTARQRPRGHRISSREIGPRARVSPGAITSGMTTQPMSYPSVRDVAISFRQFRASLGLHSRTYFRARSVQALSTYDSLAGVPVSTAMLVMSQVVVAASVLFVWTFRFEQVAREFVEYRLNDTIRGMVGSSKIMLATLLLAAIFWPVPVVVPALLMASFMLAAQFFHFRAGHALVKYVPSFVLLALSLFIAQLASSTA
jgi:hypothetical protein